jgi:predicted nucleic acid-binding protein
MERENNIKLVLAPDVLAGILANYEGEGPLIPGTEGLDVEVIYSVEVYDTAKGYLDAAGTSFGETADALLALQRLGTRAEPSLERQLFDDPARDILVRLAVGAGADYVVSSDPDLLDLREWKDVKFAPTVTAAVQAVLAGVSTVPVFRAATEMEARIAREVLEEAGIRCFEASRQIPWYDGIMMIGEGFYGELYVLKKDYERAAELLEEYIDDVD